MDIIPIKIDQGEEKAWSEVCGLPSRDVCARTGAAFDPDAGGYVLDSFGMSFVVNPCEITITPHRGNDNALLMGKLGDLFRMSVLWYLSSAKDIPTTGKLIRPVDVKGGHRFSAGTHVLPLGQIAERFGKDREGFLRQGRRFGAVEAGGFGDACIRLYPLARVPVTLVLWLDDGEFPPRVDLFFDSTCQFQLSLSDTIWAVALMSSAVMLEP